MALSSRDSNIVLVLTCSELTHTIDSKDYMLSHKSFDRQTSLLSSNTLVVSYVHTDIYSSSFATLAGLDYTTEHKQTWDHRLHDSTLHDVCLQLFAHGRWARPFLVDRSGTYDFEHSGTF